MYTHSECQIDDRENMKHLTDSTRNNGESLPVHSR